MTAHRHHWWSPDPDDFDDEGHRAGDLLQETSSIEDRQAAWHQLALFNATLYYNRVLPGFRWGDPDGTEELWPTNLHTENLVENIGQAMVSKASSSPLKPTLVPRGRKLKTEHSVRVLDNFIYAAWKQTKAEDAAVRAFEDAYWAQVGWVRVGYEDDALQVRSVFPDNVIIDNRETLNRTPPRTYRVRQCVPRASVEARYPDTPLRDCKYHGSDGRTAPEGWVIMVEAWRLPGPDGKGGRHTVAAGNRLLVDEAWKHHWVPLIPFHWTDPGSGFLSGRSGVEQLVPYQLKHNQLNADIQESQDAACRARMTVHANTQLDYSQWDSRAGRFLLWAGAAKPEPLIWPTNLGELYQERERNRQSAYSHMGLSEMFANADMPGQVRMDSSAGIREVRNMEDARHLRLWTRFEDTRMEIARTFIRVLSTAKSADAFSVYFNPGGRASVDTIAWDAVKNLNDDEYSWEMAATPLSMMSPAARREQLRDWTSRGLVQVGSEEAKRLEGNPNLEMIEDLELAGQDDIKRHMSLLEKGEYEAPTEFTNLTVGIPMVMANMHRLATYDDVRGKILSLHEQWLAQASMVVTRMVQPAAAPTPFAPTQGVPGTQAAQGLPPGP